MTFHAGSLRSASYPQRPSSRRLETNKCVLVKESPPCGVPRILPVVEHRSWVDSVPALRYR
jgi:hypothetical protein